MSKKQTTTERFAELEQRLAALEDRQRQRDEISIARMATELKPFAIKSMLAASGSEPHEPADEFGLITPSSGMVIGNNAIRLNVVEEPQDSPPTPNEEFIIDSIDISNGALTGYGMGPVWFELRPDGGYVIRFAPPDQTDAAQSVNVQATATSNTTVENSMT